jgi:prepilin-type N-terminal cleavage/methylation domain-containing protein
MLKNQKSSFIIGKSGQRRCRGLSLVEMLVSLAITALLLTATMVAIDASFKAYAVAAESASTQTSTRLVTNRLMTMIRTNYAHGPIYPDTLNGVVLDGDTVTSPYMQIIDRNGDLITIEYDSVLQQLMYTRDPGTGTITTQPIIGGVTEAEFTLKRRRDDDGVWVLERGSVDFTVQPDDDASLEIEAGNIPPVRVVASTRPRKLD